MNCLRGAYCSGSPALRRAIKSGLDYIALAWGLLAITVACLDLLGIVSFTLQKRVKEISIRKVLGATSESLVLLLSKDFVLLLVIASLITLPVMFFLFDYLLLIIQYYSIQIGFVEILASLAIMAALGLTTILSQTLRAANANPADHLSAFT